MDYTPVGVLRHFERRFLGLTKELDPFSDPSSQNLDDAWEDFFRNKSEIARALLKLAPFLEEKSPIDASIDIVNLYFYLLKDKKYLSRTRDDHRLRREMVALTHIRPTGWKSIIAAVCEILEAPYM
jgi:hypothetical protein